MRRTEKGIEMMAEGGPTTILAVGGRIMPTQQSYTLLSQASTEEAPLGLDESQRPYSGNCPRLGKEVPIG